MVKKKRRLNPKLKLLLIICGALVVILIFVSLVSSLNGGNKVKSIHSDAKKYENNSCVVFYPKSDYAKKYAKSLCDNVEKDNLVYDYTLVPYGNNYLVDYGDGHSYLADANYKLLTVTSYSEEGKYILSDYLRYYMKKAELDKAYSLEFIEETYHENLDISECTYDISSTTLNVYFPKYDYTISVPLKYIGEYLDVDLGVEQEEYVKPTYVSNNRKLLCLTFNDGPSISTTGKVVDTLYKYDSVGTFYVIGENLDASTIDIVKETIAKGNQIGSLTESGYNLYLYKETSDVIEQIIKPANDIYSGKTGSFNGLGYNVNTYRAPGGDHKAIDDVAPLMAIEWDLDVDKSSESTVTSIIEKINDFKSKNKDELNECILVLRDTRSNTADALEELLPELIKEGYQIVTVNELLSSLKIDIKKGTSYPW